LREKSEKKSEREKESAREIARARDRERERERTCAHARKKKKRSRQIERKSKRERGSAHTRARERKVTRPQNSISVGGIFQKRIGFEVWIFASTFVKETGAENEGEEGGQKRVGRRDGSVG